MFDCVALHARLFSFNVFASRQHQWYCTAFKARCLFCVQAPCLLRSVAFFRSLVMRRGIPRNWCFCCESAPAILKVGDPDKGEEQQMLRSEFLTSINMLWRNPGLIMKNNHWLEGKIRAIESAAPEGCFKSVSSFGALDETCCCAWIVGKSQLAIAVLEFACQIVT